MKFAALKLKIEVFWLCSCW